MTHQALFVSAFVYLLAAVISVPIAKRFGLSAVLGYLVAGMVIGPFVLNLVGEEGAEVMHFAEFGVVMMLFLIGLELKPSLLWRLRGSILGLGGFQVFLTTLLAVGVAMAFQLSWQMALAIGLSLSLSSTAIVLQSLQEKNLMKTPAGQSAFSVLLFQDISVIPMLAVLPLLATLSVAGGAGHHSHGVELNAFQEWLTGEPAWVNTALTLGAVVGIILAGRFLFRPLLAAVARTRVRETFVSLGLLLIIGIALLMTFLGVSPALGTFLAGVVLANSEYRHELEADIEPFKGILLGVFFISVGASIDFSLIASSPLVVFGIVLGLVVLKAAVLFVIGKVRGLSLDENLVFSLSLAQGSEFAFVLLGVAVTENVLPREMVQILVASVAISMAMTPLLLLFFEKVIRPRVGTKEEEEREPDAMEEEAPVILAGIGRFGNYIARLLRAQEVGVTVIDNDPDYIEFLRGLGIKAFYGDAVRKDLLESAGADEAQLLIIALDKEEEINRLVEVAQHHFPKLKIMARALSRPHQHYLIQKGVDTAIHQHAGSAMSLGEKALRNLGFRAHRAARLSRKLAGHDEETIHMLSEHYKDETKYVSRSRERLADLEKQFREDRERHQTEVDSAWDVEQLRADLDSGALDVEDSGG